MSSSSRPRSRDRPSQLQAIAADLRGAEQSPGSRPVRLLPGSGGRLLGHTWRPEHDQEPEGPETGFRPPEPRIWTVVPWVWDPISLVTTPFRIVKVVNRPGR